jgi:hypothetical protein
VASGTRSSTSAIWFGSWRGPGAAEGAVPARLRVSSTISCLLPDRYLAVASDDVFWSYDTTRSATLFGDARGDLSITKTASSCSSIDPSREAQTGVVAGAGWIGVKIASATAARTPSKQAQAMQQQVQAKRAPERARARARAREPLRHSFKTITSITSKRKNGTTNGRYLQAAKTQGWKGGVQGEMCCGGDDACTSNKHKVDCQCHPLFVLPVACRSSLKPCFGVAAVCTWINGRGP